MTHHCILETIHLKGKKTETRVIKFKQTGGGGGGGGVLIYINDKINYSRRFDLETPDVDSI